MYGTTMWAKNAVFRFECENKREIYTTPCSTVEVLTQPFHHNRLCVCVCVYWQRLRMCTLRDAIVFTRPIIIISIWYCVVEVCVCVPVASPASERYILLPSPLARTHTHTLALTSVCIGICVDGEVCVWMISTAHLVVSVTPWHTRRNDHTLDVIFTQLNVQRTLETNGIHTVCVRLLRSAIYTLFFLFFAARSRYCSCVRSASVSVIGRI